MDFISIKPESLSENVNTFLIIIMPIYNEEENIEKVVSEWEAILEGKTKKTIPFTTEKNLETKENPGFKDPENLDFHVVPNSLLTKELQSFEPIPTEKIGLYRDYYRKNLPSEEELDRIGKNHPQNGGLGYDILDRPN